MLRHYGQHGGGVKMYTHNLLREMLAMETPHEFVLIYRNPGMVGTYSNGDRIREIAVEAPHIFLWDQLAVRQVEKREKLDLIFNPKYSLPLRAECRTVFVCHGLDWYVMPWGSKWADRFSHRYLFPRYVRKADAIISVSDTTKNHLVQYLGVQEERIHTVYLGVNENFRKVISRKRLQDVRRIYRLPERFFLYVGQIYPAKNFGRLLQAYTRVGPKLGIHLVVAGEIRHLPREELALVNRLGNSPWVVWPGWIEHDELPAFYALAEALLIPSLYESFGIPLVEAMASGCPVLTSNRGAPAEVANDAALLVDPTDVSSIANGMYELIKNEGLRQKLIKKGLIRSREFTWDKCARQTVELFKSLG